MDEERAARVSLYEVSLPLSAEYEDVIHDALRVLVIQFTMFVMYYISSSSPPDIASYMTLQVFMWMGVAMYWLVFRKLVRIRTARNMAP
jgi:hypothetical protein